MKADILSFVLFVLLVVLILGISPLITIWSINTLFHTNIPINLYTYFASLWLTGLVAGGSGVRK